MMADKFQWTKVSMEDFWKNVVQVCYCYRLTSDVCELEGCISEMYYAQVRNEWLEYEAVPVFCLIHNLSPAPYQATFEYYVQETNLTLLAAVAAVASLEVC